MTTNITKIFTGSDDEVIVNNFNAASTKITIDSVSDLTDKSKSPSKKTTIKEDVYTYYEYIQFKRAHFDCTDIEYDGETGRVIGMKFEFNGKIN